MIINIIIQELDKLGYGVIPTQDGKEYCIIPPKHISLFWHRCNKQGVFEYYDKLVHPRENKTLVVKDNIIYIGNLNNRFFTKAEIINASFERANINARAHTIGRGHKQVDVFCEGKNLNGITILSNEYKLTFHPKYDLMGNVLEHRFWGLCEKNH